VREEFKSFSFNYFLCDFMPTDKKPPELEMFEAKCFGTPGAITDVVRKRYKEIEEVVPKLLSPEYIKALNVLRHGGRDTYFDWQINAGIEPKTMETVAKDLIDKYHLVDKKEGQSHDDTFYSINEDGLRIWEAARAFYEAVTGII